MGKSAPGHLALTVAGSRMSRSAHASCTHEVVNKMTLPSTEGVTHRFPGWMVYRALFGSGRRQTIRRVRVWAFTGDGSRLIGAGGGGGEIDDEWRPAPRSRRGGRG